MQHKFKGRFADELSILRRINSSKKEYPGRKYVTTLLDNFTITGHHGAHLCLVSAACGAFKGSIFNSGQKLPVVFVKVIGRQLLFALDYLHRECRIIHTGTFIVLFSLQILMASKDLKSDNILLELFSGNGGWPHVDVIQPYALRAPEVILGNGWHTAADIWNLGCLLFEFLTGSWLFSPRGGPTWSAESYHLAHMPVITGEGFDLEYIRKGKHFEKYFTPEGHLSIQVQNILNLEQALDAYRVLDDAEKPLCIDFLKSMLRLKPSDRSTAAELLEHSWII
ncbi:hypothetical protein GALMADRAFT_1333939 [Galerina marginata CBS 339.88]|uniref:non-specific serine/threonine protein kinase n=1 Tax=Galerina marginata (strain CBS 339.88) TaxID=685588 RepID=A0A067T6H1_GALM3|nr:hypothetical protein GALMADRAFT_1333939 [Galerina marginata CBS 339.88]